MQILFREHRVTLAPCDMINTYTEIFAITLTDFLNFILNVAFLLLYRYPYIAPNRSYVISSGKSFKIILENRVSVQNEPKGEYWIWKGLQ